MTSNLLKVRFFVNVHPKAIRIRNRYFLISFSLYLSVNKNFWKEKDVVLICGAL
jgi:hypothetical protein